MKIVLATSNSHKLDEIVAIWRDQPHDEAVASIELVGLDTIDTHRAISEPIEDGQTFEDNAVLKARHYAAATGMVALADDSGLEVDALGGEPGVCSARFARAIGPRPIVDQANNKLLLEKLKDTPAQQRAARFVCAMALVAPGDGDGVLVLVRGTVEGRIIGPGEQRRGENGFGYDPLFFVPELGKTTAELSGQEKNAISHRGQAARLMWRRFQRFGADLTRH